MFSELTGMAIVVVIAIVAAIVTEVRYSQRKKKAEKAKEQREPIRVIDFNSHCDCEHCKCKEEE